MWYLRPSWKFISAELENISVTNICPFLNISFHFNANSLLQITYFWHFITSLKDSKFKFKIFWFFHSLPPPNCRKWGILEVKALKGRSSCPLLSPEIYVLVSPLNCKIYLLESICIFGSWRKLLLFSSNICIFYISFRKLTCLFKNLFILKALSKIPHTVVCSVQTRIVELAVIGGTKPQFLSQFTLTWDLLLNPAHSGTD